MNKNTTAYAQYIADTKDILNSPALLRLKDYDQHLGTSRLSHSIRVSYKSFRIARFLGWNARAAARGGLLHDMFYYNFRGSALSPREHCRLHPEFALANASTSFPLTELEGEIITSHMWLASRTRPFHKEAYLVTFVDKYCAAVEVAVGLFRLCFSRTKVQKIRTKVHLL